MKSLHFGIFTFYISTLFVFFNKLRLFFTLTVFIVFRSVYTYLKYLADCGCFTYTFLPVWTIPALFFLKIEF